MADTWTPKLCIRCNTLFEDNPAHTVECPVTGCYAPVGEPCRQFDGHAFADTPSHPQRLELASKNTGHCTGVKPDHEKAED